MPLLVAECAFCFHAIISYLEGIFRIKNLCHFRRDENCKVKKYINKSSIKYPIALKFQAYIDIGHRLEPNFISYTF